MTQRHPMLRKRILIPGAIAAMLLAALGLAIVRSNTSRIIVYNNSGERLPGLRLGACGQSHLFAGLDDEDSVRWKLGPNGPGTEVELEMAAETPQVWHGVYIEPKGGYIVTLRVQPDGSVESHSQIAFWRRFLRLTRPVDD